MIIAAQPKQWFIQHVLNADTADALCWKSAAQFVARLIYAVLQDLARGQLMLQATSYSMKYWLR